MIRQILVPIDGSAASMHALDVAIEFAESMNATLVVMSVVDAVPGWVGAPATDTAALIKESANRFQKQRDALLRHALELVPESVPARKVLTEGHPAEKILKQLMENDYDLVVMGSRGLHGMGAVLLGSVSRNVLQSSKVPVLVVRADDGRQDWREPDGD